MLRIPGRIPTGGRCGKVQTGVQRDHHQSLRVSARQSALQRTGTLPLRSRIQASILSSIPIGSSIPTFQSMIPGKRSCCSKPRPLRRHLAPTLIEETPIPTEIPATLVPPPAEIIELPTDTTTHLHSHGRDSAADRGPAHFHPDGCSDRTCRSKKNL